MRRFGKFVHADDFVEAPYNNLYAITFDDGFETVYQNAIPVLEKFKCPYTIFFPVQFLGLEPNWKTFKDHDISNEKIININIIKLLNTQFFKIGSHTINHQKVSLLNNTEKQVELCSSKVLLEQITDLKVETISFPYGDYDENAIKIAQACGYKFAFDIIPKFITKKNDKNFVRGRISIDFTENKIVFLMKIFGAFNWLDIYTRTFKNKK
jgi:peptidoglycan/xylan/chitin deacetylase (PgdA/CDA1 family)